MKIQLQTLILSLFKIMGISNWNYMGRRPKNNELFFTHENKENFATILDKIEILYNTVSKATHTFDDVLIEFKVLLEMYNGDKKDLKLLINILLVLGFIEEQTDNNFSIYTPRFLEMSLDEILNMYIIEMKSLKNSKQK